MSDEQYALSPAPTQPPPPTEADYEAIFAAVMETVRGRWFLSEFARRNRQADTQTVLAAIERLESMVRKEQEDPAFERIRTDIRDMADAIAATKREIAAMRQDGAHKGIGEATEELDSIVMATERATSDILAAAETIQETAWTLREQGLDGASCDKLDRCATDVYLACSFQDLTGQRTRKIIQVMRYLEGRINAMVDILGEDDRHADAAAPTHVPLDIDMDQAEIDAVIPTTHAGRRAAAAETAASCTPSPAAETATPAGSGMTIDMEPVTPEPGEAVSAFDETAFEPTEPEPIISAATAGPSLPDIDLTFADAGSETSGEPRPAEAAAEVETALDFAVDDDLDADAAVSVHPADDVTAEFDAGSALVKIAGIEAPPQEQPPADTFDAEADRIAAAEALLAATAAGGVPTDAAASDEAALDAATSPWGPSVAPDTKALMADLLAIIRPPEASDAVGTEPDDRAGAEQDSATDDRTARAPPREDLRLMRPIVPGALSSEFVIVPLAIDVDAGAIATTDGPALAAAFETPDPVAEADIAPPAEEPVVIAAAAEPPPEAEASLPPAPLFGSAFETGAATTSATTDGPALAAAFVEPEPIAETDIAPPAEEPVVIAAAAEPPPEAEASLPPAPLFGNAVETGAAATMEISGLDNDLLMAAEALGPRETAAVEQAAYAEPEPAVVTNLVDLDSDLLMATDAAAPDVSPVADRVHDAEGTAGTATETFDADVLAPPLAAPTMDDDALPTTDIVAGDAGWVTDEAAGRSEAAAEPSPEPSASDERPTNDPEDDVVLLPPVAMGISAAAALAALAVPVPVAAAATGETTGEEIGHADPLAAVNALSVEERIALFS